MTAFKLDFPYNLLMSVKIGKDELITKEDGDFSIVTPITIKESLLFKIIKAVGALWQVA